MTQQYCTGEGKETNKTEAAEGYPGIPETNVQILESLRRAREQQEICVFWGENPVEFWLGCYSTCFKKLPIAESKRQELLEKRKMREQQGIDPLVAGEYILGFYQDPSLFLPEHFCTVWLDPVYLSVTIL